MLLVVIAKAQYREQTLVWNKTRVSSFPGPRLGLLTVIQTAESKYTGLTWYPVFRYLPRPPTMNSRALSLARRLAHDKSNHSMTRWFCLVRYLVCNKYIYGRTEEMKLHASASKDLMYVRNTPFFGVSNSNFWSSKNRFINLKHLACPTAFQSYCCAQEWSGP